ncbi:MAG: phytanoyl-CoA dioxygenase family protein [Burkholderiaceae bacterium]
MTLARADFDRYVQSLTQDGFAVLHEYLDTQCLSRLRISTDALLNPDTAPPGSPELTDYEPLLLDGQNVVQRIRKPYLLDPLFFDLARSDQILSLLRPIIGPDIRLHHGKINIKAATVGSPLEWHQDWAFIPHSNQSMAIVSILIDDCAPENGPLQFVPGTHNERLHNHHHDGVFVGAIDPTDLDLEKAIPTIGRAGTITVHHPMTVHGSGMNTGNSPRRMLFLEYAAADAWPLFYGVEWAEFNARMMCGVTTNKMRFSESEVRMPFPNGSEGQGRIYDLQRTFHKRYFETPKQAPGQSGE